MLAPLRRCVDGWPCMVGDLRGRNMRTGSKIENLSTTRHGESRELQLLLFNFLCNLNRAAYKWSAENVGRTPRHYPVAQRVTAYRREGSHARTPRSTPTRAAARRV